jgi:parallel beta-helix repeat protein
MRDIASSKGEAIRRLAVAFTTALTLLGMTAGAASGQPAQCGQVITGDVTLESDLHCSGDGLAGLVIGADGVTLDLGGHTLFDDIASRGIDNSGGYDRVTIRNGAVSAGAVGIELRDASRNRLVNLEAQITVTGGDRNVVRDSRLPGARSGGLEVAGSDRMRILRNTVSGHWAGAMHIDSNGSLIAGNITIRGIVVAGSDNRIVRNLVQDGFTLPNIVVESGAGNVIARNWILANQAAFGIELRGGTNTVVRDNLVTGAAFDGISVTSEATTTTVSANVATGNRDDGIGVESATTAVARNVASTNGDLGIEAAPGVIDGGGNRAAGNGNALQCVNVLCGR